MIDEKDDEKEWPNLEKAPQLRKYIHKHTRNNPEPIPLFIRECGRFIPIKNEKSGYIDWHPFNMPEYIVRRVVLTGMITKYQTNAKYIVFQLYDGSGAITVLYPLSKYQTDLDFRKAIDVKHDVSQEKAQKIERAMKIKLRAEDLGNSSAKSINKFQDENLQWWTQTREGMAGKPLTVGDYVEATGYCGMRQDALMKKGEKKPEECLWKYCELPEMMFNAFMVRAITEKQYNDKVARKFYNDVAKKYIQK